MPHQKEQRKLLNVDERDEMNEAQEEQRMNERNGNLRNKDLQFSFGFLVDFVICIIIWLRRTSFEHLVEMK